jgi:glycosyltransferase involved in cell wall biosynthesis
MKVLIFGMDEGNGGAQTAFREFVSFLRQEGIDVGTVVTRDSEYSTSELKEYTLCEVPLSAHSASARMTKAFSVGRAAWLARRFQPDVFVSVGLARTANVVAHILPRSTFKIAQDFIFGRPTNDPLLRSSSRVFNAIGVQTPSMVTSLLDAGFRARPVNWVPCIPQAPIAGCLKLARRAVDSVRLAYFGRIARNKGLHLILEALANAEFAIPVTLDIWGSGEDILELRWRCNELGLLDQVSFCGDYPSAREGAILMCSYDSIVLPSTGCEGLPLILIEAMAYGLPFLATDVGAISECCDGNPDSILVKPEVEALRDGLIQLVKMVRSEELRPERLRRFYDLRFSRSVMQQRWLECLNAPEAFFNVAK